MNETQQKQLLSYAFILSVVVLLLNDFYLKNTFHNLMTGKLSDFAGLFALPFFISAFFPNKKTWIYIITGLAFILWKLPITDNFIMLWNKYIPFSIYRTIDYSDYTALLVLPISYLHQNEKPYFFSNSLIIKRIVTPVIFSVSVFSFLATAGAYGRISSFELGYSKNEVNKAIKALYMKYPEYTVPIEYNKYTESHYGGEETEFSKRIQADSVSFHFYIKDKSIIFWSGFELSEEKWYERNCELVVEGFANPPKGKWKYDKDVSKDESKEITKIFENEIMIKLKAILKEQK